jgi:hypothetical protein
MKNTIIFIVSVFFVFSCSNSNEIGGIKAMKLGRDWLKPEKIERYKNRPKTGMKATFRITHKNIDLSNYDIFIDARGYHLYYGHYQKDITFYLPGADENYATNLTFRIINRETDSLYYFTSDLSYYIFKTDEPIKVKLLPDAYRVILDLKSCYRLRGCPVFKNY